MKLLPYFVFFVLFAIGVILGWSSADAAKVADTKLGDQTQEAFQTEIMRITGHEDNFAEFNAKHEYELNIADNVMEESGAADYEGKLENWKAYQAENGEAWSLGYGAIACGILAPIVPAFLYSKHNESDKKPHKLKVVVMYLWLLGLGVGAALFAFYAAYTGQPLLALGLAVPVLLAYITIDKTTNAVNGEIGWMNIANSQYYGTVTDTKVKDETHEGPPARTNVSGVPPADDANDVAHGGQVMQNDAQQLELNDAGKRDNDFSLDSELLLSQPRGFYLRHHQGQGNQRFKRRLLLHLQR